MFAFPSLTAQMAGRPGEYQPPALGPDENTYIPAGELRELNCNLASRTNTPVRVLGKSLGLKGNGV